MEHLRKIELYAKENNWRLFMTRKADPAFLSFQEKIFHRDQYTCQYCGFQALDYLEIINGDQNYLNNRISNLTTACPFCAQCCFLEAVGKSDFGSGTLIYLPEMPQNSLNALCHVLFANIISGSDSYEKTARNIYRSLKLRSQLVEKEMGEGLSSPALCGQLIIEATIADKANFLKILNTKVRLLPDMLKFSEKLDMWMVKGLQSLMY